VHKRQNARNPCEASHRFGRHARRTSQLLLQRNTFSRTHRVTNPSEQFRRRNRIVGREQSITPRNRVCLVANNSLSKHAVSNQLAFAREQDDLSRRNLPHVSPLNEKKIARPHRGKHAQPRHFQSQCAKCPQNLRRHLALQRVFTISQFELSVRHDNFLFIVHEACVAFTFPQESAEVTNTRS
jgi:hypothetical protein